MPAPLFRVNTDRLDPYKSYRFKVKMDGDYVMACNRISPLRRVTHVVETRDGGESSVVRKSPGQTSYEPIILEAGVTHDPTFEQWANKVRDNSLARRGKNDVSLKDFRKNIRIELYNEAGQLALAYNVYRCWPSEYQALPQLDSASSEVAIATITLQNEGWERDLAVTEPTEESYLNPTS